MDFFDTKIMWKNITIIGYLDLIRYQENDNTQKPYISTSQTKTKELKWLLY